MGSMRTGRRMSARASGRGWGWAAVLTLVLLGACTTPAARFAETAGSMGFERQIVTGAGFRHVLFWHHGARATLPVYIAAAGTPESGGYPAADPPSRNPLMLRLLGLDPGPAVLLGRPCYEGLANDPGCRPALWMDERYSEAVVASMAAALREILAQGPYRRVAWFGHSGGGRLAVVLAGRGPGRGAVFTAGPHFGTDA